MPAHNIIIGQHVDPVKAERAKALRRNMTETEAALWQYLRANRLGGFHFRRQQVIDGFIVDFYCHVAALAIEVDGGIHAEQSDYDTERDGVLAARGLRVVRVTKKDVREDLDGVLRRILAACGEGPNPPAPFPRREGGA